MEEKRISEYLALRGLIYGNYESHFQVISHFRYTCLVLATMALLGLMFCAAADNVFSNHMAPFALSAVILGFGLFLLIETIGHEEVQKKELNALDDAFVKGIDFKDIELLKKYYPNVKK